MKKKNISKDLSSSVKNLLKIARESSFNDISDNCSYILSEIKPSNKTSFEQTKARKIANDQKTPKSFAEIMTELEHLYPNLYDVNLYIYRADLDSTLIEIQYFPRTSLDKEYQETSATQETMLHCKVSIPPNNPNNVKFDINWEHQL